MSYPEAYLRAAHTHCSNHRVEVEASRVCGCFYCLQNYAPTDIENWVDDPGGTAICPQCSIDSVIGEASGYPVTKPEFLDAMHEFWFQRTITLPGSKPASEALGLTSLFRRLFLKTT